MLIHLLTPHGLSWTRNGVPKTNEAHDLLIREKRNALPEDLCKGLSPVFEEFLRYTRRLKFEQAPDYRSWIKKFKKLAIDEGYSARDDFIWPPPQPVSLSSLRQMSTLKSSFLRSTDTRQPISHAA